MSHIGELLTVQEVAEKLKVTPQYARKLVNEGKLMAARIGKQWVVSPDDLASYISMNNISIEPDDHERVSSAVPASLRLASFPERWGLI